MGNKYSGSGAAAAGTNKTILNLFNVTASPTKRAHLYYLSLSCGDTPADLTGKFSVGRTTAIGTEGSGFTPNPMDSNEVAAESDFGVAHSAEPTYTSNKQMLQVAVHQRTSFQWYAHPGSEIIVPATQNNGLGLKSLAHGGTPSYTATMFFWE